jgi:hypothetical protein
VTSPEGFTTRPPILADAAAVADLVNAFERAHVEDPDTVDADEVTGWWSRIEPERDSRLYVAADGRLAGVATLSDRNQGKLDLDAYVLPEHAGRGSVERWSIGWSRRRSGAASSVRKRPP